MPDYQIIRSKRKTLALEVTRHGLIVRAPLRCSQAQIDDFIARNQAWIEKHLQLAEERKQAEAALPPLTKDELHALAEQALQTIPERVRYYAARLGVSYGRITIRNQKTKWGSCSARGDLNFNCLLMLAPPEVLDSIVVHELCHLKYMNHSDAFYAEVLRVFPDYPKCHRWLKENGHLLMSRNP